MNPTHPSAEHPIFFNGHAEPDNMPFDAWALETLLVSMEMGGVNWPSSCRNGTCRTCIGQLESGTVRYEIDWPGLSPEEKEEGYVLPCVAYPCTDVRLKGSDI